MCSYSIIICRHCVQSSLKVFFHRAFEITKSTKLDDVGERAPFGIGCFHIERPYIILQNRP